jgi:hypothetical protein
MAHHGGTSVEHLIHARWRAFAVTTLAVLGLLAVGASFLKEIHDNAKQQATDRCVARWAVAYSARADFINKYLSPRNDAFNALEAALNTGASQSTVATLRTAFLKADAAYQSAQKSNPLPPPVKFACKGIPGVAALISPSPSAVRSAARTSSPRPSPGVSTVTKTPPAHSVPILSPTLVTVFSTAHGSVRTEVVREPGATRTIRVPGPTVTVTRTVGPRPIIPLPTLTIGL